MGRYKLTEDAKAINPYTFIPIIPEDRAYGENEGRKGYYHDAKKYYEDRGKLLTGKLHCEIEVETPLAMSVLKQSEIYGKKKDGDTYWIDRSDSECIIPGSSIRGMLRSAFETVTNSCFSTMRNKSILSRRQDPQKAYDAGILKITEDGSYELYPAKRYRIPIRGKSQKKITFPVYIENEVRYVEYLFEGQVYRGKTGDKVDFTFKNGDIVTGIKPGTEGFLCIGESFSNKFNESILKYEAGKGKIEFTSDEIKESYERLEKVHAMYQDKAINKNFKSEDPKEEHTGYGVHDKIKGCKEIPLWYKIQGQSLYLSYAMIGRVNYNTYLNELAGKRCEDRTSVCEACLLFGMMGDSEADKQNLGLGSRLRFSDARMVDQKTEVSVVTVKELAKPHLSYLPFYAEYENSEDVPDSYDTNEEDGKGKVKIRGRKFYWHNQSAKEDPTIYTVEKAAQTERNVDLHLIKPGTKFTFDVYYDGIRNDELSQLDKLIWVITLGENNFDSKLCHKLGQGKPLGLGSVKIVIDKQTKRTVDEFSYAMNTVEFDAAQIKEPTDYPEIMESFKKAICIEDPFAGIDEESEIDYPHLVDCNNKKFSPEELNGDQRNAKAAHRWFSENLKEKPIQKLPKILQDDQRLNMYQYIED